MTQPLHLSEQAWKDAETLVQRMEAESRHAASAGSYYDELVSGLRFVCGAKTVTLSLGDPDGDTTLARSGVRVHPQSLDPAIDPDGDPSGASRFGVSADASLHGPTQLQLDLQFDQPLSLATEEHLRDLAEVLLASTSGVFLRHEYAQLRKQLSDQSDRDEFIGGLNEGADIEESFAAIASAIASRTSAERVSVLKLDPHRAKLVATSPQPRVDHRGEVTRSLQYLVVTAGQGDSLVWTAEADTISDPLLAEALESHVTRCNCDELFLRKIDDATGTPIAAVVLERFRPPTDQDTSLDSQWRPIAAPVETAIVRAIRRDHRSSRMLHRFAANPKRTAIGAGLLVLSTLIIALVPTKMRIPSQGRVVAAERGRLFAPAQGLISEVLVDNQQWVQPGETLIQMTSPALDQAMAEVEGELATTRTQLASLLAMRSSTNTSRAQNGSTLSADERVLQTEIEGLEKQLAVIAKQQARLTITSPIRGRVDGWDLTRSMSGRPVAAGQHLMDVIDPEGGYQVELQLPDRLLGYLYDESPPSGRHVAIRLRSDPTETYTGVIEKVATTSQPNAMGESTVRISVQFLDDPTGPLRHGATVVAQIDGPRRSFGFVWLRRVVEWSREQIWF